MRDPDGIYLLKINNRNIRTKSEIYSKLIIKKDRTTYVKKYTRFYNFL